MKNKKLNHILDCLKQYVKNNAGALRLITRKDNHFLRCVLTSIKFTFVVKWVAVDDTVK